MQAIYDENTGRFAFLDLTFEEITIIEYALIEYAMRREGGSEEGDAKDLIDGCDAVQEQAF